MGVSPVCLFLQCSFTHSPTLAQYQLGKTIADYCLSPVCHPQVLVAAKKCAILPGRKAPVVWFRDGRLQARRKNIMFMTAYPLKASPVGRGRTCL
jgi:hypothetical protein